MDLSPRKETDWQRVDRNLNELLQELRIALPGVQVLFAFLLAVPFQQRFGMVTDFQKSVYFATLLFTAMSTVLLIAPTAFHRLTFHKRRKPQLLRLANRMTITGLGCLALAIVGAITLITDFLYGPTATWLAAIIALACFVVLWLVIPLLARANAED